RNRVLAARRGENSQPRTAALHSFECIRFEFDARGGFLLDCQNSFYAYSKLGMNIHEYQAKQLLAQYGVPVPAGDVCDTPEAAKALAEKLFAGGASRLVIKAQVHAGGRGKGTFKSGFKGGVQLCQTADQVFQNAKAMLGNV